MSTRKDKQNKTVGIIAGCIVAFGIGYFMVEFISTRERPPLGMTFHVIVGCLLMCLSVIMICVELRKIFFPKKKKKKGSRPVFLDPDQKAKSRTDSE